MFTHLFAKVPRPGDSKGITLCQVAVCYLFNHSSV